MGDILEQNRWPENIYRVQTEDYITGGQDGIINIQPRQIAERTLFLRHLLEKEHIILKREDVSQQVSGILGEFYMCRHTVKDSMLADDAAIDYDKLVLEVPLEVIKDKLNQATDNIAELMAGVHALVGVDGFLVHNLARLVRLSWRYSDFGFDFEFFVDDLTMRDLNNIHSRGAVARDDSVDCETTAGLSPGMHLLLADATKSEEVEIWKVLENGRIRLTKDIVNTYDPETTIIGYTDWDVQTGYAVARSGGVYYSHVSSVLQDAPYGKLLICRDSFAGVLKVEFRTANADGVWVEAKRTDVTDAPAEDAGYVLEHYTIDGGFVQLRITMKSTTPVTVRYMALFPLPMSQLVSSIKAPLVRMPTIGQMVYLENMAVQDSIFRCAYKDNYVRTEYALVDPGTGDVVSNIVTVENGAVTSVSEEVLPEPGYYQIRCRHMSDIGEWSPWSEPVAFHLKESQFFFGFVGADRAGGFWEYPMVSLAEDRVRFGFVGAKQSGGFDTTMFTMKTED